MRKNNTYSKWGFIGTQLFYAVLSMIWYRSILFRTIGTESLFHSKLVLYLILVSCCGLGMAIEMTARRNGWSIAANLLISYGVYTAFSYYPLRKGLIIALLAAGAVVCILVAVPVLFRKIANKAKAKRIIKRRVLYVLNRSKIALACVFLILLCSLGLHAAFGDALFRPTVQPPTESEVSQQTISNNIDTILLLQEDEWAKLTIIEKLNVMQTVANIEQRYLGIPYSITVGADNLPEDEYGNYSDRTHTITLSLYCLENESARDSLEALLHEAYHCYQHSLVEMYDRLDEQDQNLLISYKLSVYKDEFTNYIDADDDLLGYYSQTCEKDARWYAYLSLDDYYDAIEEYLHPEGSASVMEASNDN